jgi:hypothetical protein
MAANHSPSPPLSLQLQTTPSNFPDSQPAHSYRASTITKHQTTAQHTPTAQCKGCAQPLQQQGGGYNTEQLLEATRKGED